MDSIKSNVGHGGGVQIKQPQCILNDTLCYPLLDVSYCIPCRLATIICIMEALVYHNNSQGDHDLF